MKCSASPARQNGMTGDERKTLISQWTGLVPFVLKTLGERGQTKSNKYDHNKYAEVRSAAFLGLCRAARWWDENRGVKFNTYAITAIRHAIFSFWRKKKTTSNRELLSLFVGGWYDPAIPLKSEGQDGVAITRAIEALFHRIPHRSREMVWMKFNGSTLSKIGEKFGITKERARQVVAATMERLQERMENIGLRWDDVFIRESSSNVPRGVSTEDLYMDDMNDYAVRAYEDRFDGEGGA